MMPNIHHRTCKLHQIASINESPPVLLLIISIRASPVNKNRRPGDRKISCSWIPQPWRSQDFHRRHRSVAGSGHTFWTSWSRFLEGWQELRCRCYKMISIIVAFQDQKTPSSLTVITSSKISRSSSMVKGPTAASGFGDGIEEAVTRFEQKKEILLMEEILHHLECIKPFKLWDIYHTNWLAGFLPCTVWSLSWRISWGIGGGWICRRTLPQGCNTDAGHHHQWVIWKAVESCNSNKSTFCKLISWAGIWSHLLARCYNV